MARSARRHCERASTSSPVCYGRKLVEAGVRTACVRYNGTIHDFMMLNPLRATAATTAATEQAIDVLRKALGST